MCKLKNITFILFSLAIVVLAVTSMLDVITGEEGTSMAVYRSTPFAVMWGVLTFLAMAYILRRKLWKSVPATWLIHASFALILCGALVTHLWGVQGRLHVREDAPADAFEFEEEGAGKLPFTVCLESFEILYYPGTSEPKDFVCKLHFVGHDSDQHVVVSMNNIATCQHYRFCQSSYDSDLRGSILLVSYDPWGIGITYTGYGLLLLGMLLFWWQPKSQFRQIRRSKFINIFIFVLCILPLCIDFRPMMTYIRPVLRSPFFPIHVVAISISYALLIYIMINGIVACCLSKKKVIDTEREARDKKILRMKELSQLMLYPALFLLIAGIFLGAVWANVSWGRYWGWDSKEVWALITMMIYCLPLHQQSISWFAKPVHFHLYCSLAFLTVLMTYFGVNYFLVGLHSYA